MVEMLGEEGEIFGCELVLQRFGCGGDHHTTAGDDAGNEVCERLSCASPGFDHEMVAFDD